MYLRLLLALPLLGSLLLPSQARAAVTKPTLVVRSSPAGATLRVDGVDVGPTPQTLKALSAGAHTVQVVKAGFHPFSQKVTLHRGAKTSVDAKLKRTTLLTDTQRAQRKQALGQHAAGLFVWQKIGPGSLLDGLGGGALLRAKIAAQGAGLQLDPITGYYVSVDDPGDGTLTTSFFLDADGTEPAGTTTIDLFAGTVDWSFTAGELDGFAGHIEATANGSTGSGTLPGGSTWSETLTIDISANGQSITITGAIDVTDAQSHTDHWGITWTADLNGAGGGPHFHLVTSDGYTLDFQVNADGSGSGSLQNTTSGAVLATFTFTVDGTMTVTYADGTTETFTLSDYLP